MKNNLENIKKALKKAFEVYNAGLEGIKEYKKDFKNECKENLEWSSLHKEERQIKQQKEVLQEALTRIKKDKKALEITFETYQTLFDFENKNQEIFNDSKEKILDDAYSIIKEDDLIGEFLIEQKAGILILNLK